MHVPLTWTHGAGVIGHGLEGVIECNNRSGPSRTQRGQYERSSARAG